MKYILIFIIILSFIGPSTKQNTNLESTFKNSFYNYLTCIDSSVNYLTKNIPLFSSLSNISYERIYKNVMKDRTFIKHLVASGETLDSLINLYNNEVGNIENFRKVVYKENNGIVSDNYELKSGQYIVIPSDYK